MPPIRSAKVSYFAAFLLGALIAVLCLHPVRSAVTDTAAVSFSAQGK